MSWANACTKIYHYISYPICHDFRPFLVREITYNYTIELFYAI